jgi:hypothetical protein
VNLLPLCFKQNFIAPNPEEDKPKSSWTQLFTCLEVTDGIHWNPHSWPVQYVAIRTVCARVTVMFVKHVVRAVMIHVCRGVIQSFQHYKTYTQKSSNQGKVHWDTNSAWTLVHRNKALQVSCIWPVFPVSVPPFDGKCKCAFEEAISLLSHLYVMKSLIITVLMTTPATAPIILLRRIFFVCI